MSCEWTTARLLPPRWAGTTSVAGTPAKREAMAERRDDLARSIYQAGHHTTLQHATFQFVLDNPNATPRNARVVVFYAGQPEIQYARDLAPEFEKDDL